MNVEEECSAAMFHSSIGLSMFMVHVQQVEENRNRKHTRAGTNSTQAENNFSRKSSTEIKDKPKFKKVISHQGESCFSKDHYDRDSKTKFKSRKYAKLHGGKCMRGSNAC